MPLSERSLENGRGEDFGFDLDRFVKKASNDQASGPPDAELELVQALQAQEPVVASFDRDTRIMSEAFSVAVKASSEKKTGVIVFEDIKVGDVFEFPGYSRGVVIQKHPKEGILIQWTKEGLGSDWFQNQEQLDHAAIVRVAAANLHQPTESELDHEYMRIKTLDHDQLITRLYRITDPQKMFAFSKTLHKAKYPDIEELAYDRLESMGYNKEGVFEGQKRAAGVEFNEGEKKWYGWSHRAKYGFGVGDKVKEGDVLAGVYPVGHEIKSLDEAKEAAEHFAELVSSLKKADTGINIEKIFVPGEEEVNDQEPKPEEPEEVSEDFFLGGKPLDFGVGVASRGVFTKRNDLDIHDKFDKKAGLLQGDPVKVKRLDGSTVDGEVIYFIPNTDEAVVRLNKGRIKVKIGKPEASTPWTVLEISAKKEVKAAEAGESIRRKDNPDRPGTITSVDPGTGKAKVRWDDSGVEEDVDMTALEVVAKKDPRFSISDLTLSDLPIGTEVECRKGRKGEVVEAGEGSSEKVKVKWANGSTTSEYPKFLFKRKAYQDPVEHDLNVYLKKQDEYDRQRRIDLDQFLAGVSDSFPEDGGYLEEIFDLRYEGEGVDELVKQMENWGKKGFTAEQVYNWNKKHGVNVVDDAEIYMDSQDLDKNGDPLSSSKMATSSSSKLEWDLTSLESFMVSFEALSDSENTDLAQSFSPEIVEAVDNLLLTDPGGYLGEEGEIVVPELSDSSDPNIQEKVSAAIEDSGGVKGFRDVYNKIKSGPKKTAADTLQKPLGQVSSDALGQEALGLPIRKKKDEEYEKRVEREQRMLEKSFEPAELSFAEMASVNKVKAFKSKDWSSKDDEMLRKALETQESGDLWAILEDEFKLDSIERGGEVEKSLKNKDQVINYIIENLSPPKKHGFWIDLITHLKHDQVINYMVEVVYENLIEEGYTPAEALSIMEEEFKDALGVSFFKDSDFANALVEHGKLSENEIKKLIREFNKETIPEFAEMASVNKVKAFKGKDWGPKDDERLKALLNREENETLWAFLEDDFGLTSEKLEEHPEIVKQLKTKEQLVNYFIEKGSRQYKHKLWVELVTETGSGKKQIHEYLLGLYDDFIGEGYSPSESLMIIDKEFGDDVDLGLYDGAPWARALIDGGRLSEKELKEIKADY